jgi:hypothetical protein
MFVPDALVNVEVVAEIVPKVTTEEVERRRLARDEDTFATSERLFAACRKNVVFCEAAEPRFKEEEDTTIEVAPEPDTAPERVMVWLPVSTGFVPTRIYPDAVMFVDDTLAMVPPVVASIRVEETLVMLPCGVSRDVAAVILVEDTFAIVPPVVASRRVVETFEPTALVKFKVGNVPYPVVVMLVDDTLVM